MSGQVRARHVSVSNVSRKTSSLLRHESATKIATNREKLHDKQGEINQRGCDSCRSRPQFLPEDERPKRSGGAVSYLDGNKTTK